MVFQQLSQSLSEKLQGKILLEEPMKNHTTWKIGGPTDILVIPEGIQDVVTAVSEANRLQIPITIIGNGSNALVKDGGIKGLVVKISNGLNKINVTENLIEAEAGVMLSKIARIAASHELTGLEFAVGIPATLGGAIVMNAGALGGEISRYIEKIGWVDMKGNIQYSEKKELEFSYRHTTFPEKELVLIKAWLRLEPGNSDRIDELMVDSLNKRKLSQPVNKPNAGSVFKNPLGYSAGKLIEEAGLKGKRVGDAQVSELHANFIVNLGNATAIDVLDLINIITNRVMDKFGIKLEMEVKVLGEA